MHTMLAPIPFIFKISKKLLFFGAFLIMCFSGYGQAGSVAISGTLQEGSVLTAIVTDGNGATGAITYLWESSPNGATPWTTVGGATNTYTLLTSDVGDFIRVTATYTDDNLNPETPVSLGRTGHDPSFGTDGPCIECDRTDRLHPYMDGLHGQCGRNGL